MSGYRRYPSPLRQTTRALTAKIALIATVAVLLIGGLIAVQMAAGDDPALGPKAAAKARKASANAFQGGSTSSSSGSASDPYSQSYGDDYYYGGSSGYSSGSSGSSSGSSQQYSAPPVTSSTS